jgi:hypothetical protein
MSIKQSSDTVQEVMENLFHDLDDGEVYIDDIDDIECFSSSFSTHIYTYFGYYLNMLRENCFTMNPSKCEWAVQETDWLGYWITTTGLKP